MQPRTAATLDELNGLIWFHAVGVHDFQTAETLSSWPEAIESCATMEWENLCIDAANHYRQRVVERSPVRFDKWNDIALSLKPIVDAIVSEKTQQVMEQHRLPKVFADTVHWDILHLCMEAEYADVYPPGFFASQSFWYAKGHFPCGWIGKFPLGKLVIY